MEPSIEIIHTHIQGVAKLWMGETIATTFMSNVDAIIKAEYERGKKEALASA